MIDELHKIQGDITRAGLTSSLGVTQKIAMPAKNRRRFFLLPLKVLALLFLLLAGVALFVFLTGKSGMDEGRSTAAGKPPAQLSLQPGPEKTSGAVPQGEEKIVDPAAGAAVEGQTPDAVEKNQAAQTIRDATAAGETKLNPGPQGQAVALDAGPGVPPRKNEPEKGQARVEPPLDKGSPRQEGNAGADKLGPLDEELSRLRGFMETRDFSAADRLTDALLRSGAESRAFPMLGKVKFLMGQFAAAGRLWSRALQDNLLVSLEMVHLHGNAADACLGQLKFKRKFILFNSTTRGDHSFAITSDDLRPLTLGGDMGIRITGVVAGQEIDESFMVAGKLLRLQKERFLVDFINENVL
jgi:hypothetical protein